MKTLIAAIFLLLTSLAAQAQTVTVNSLTATPAAVQPGQTIVFAATMTANQNYSNYPVEFSVMPPGASPGTNTDQIVFFVSFPAGKPVTQTYNWTVPAGLAPGTYKAELAVFNSHWSAVLALKDIAFTVSAAGGTPAPVASSVPAITGTAQVNATLTASTGTWTGATSYAYSWARNGTPIAGAAGATYTPSSTRCGVPADCHRHGYGAWGYGISDKRSDCAGGGGGSGGAGESPVASDLRNGPGQRDPHGFDRNVDRRDFLCL